MRLIRKTCHAHYRPHPRGCSFSFFQLLTFLFSKYSWCIHREFSHTAYISEEHFELKIQCALRDCMEARLSRSFCTQLYCEGSFQRSSKKPSTMENIYPQKTRKADTRTEIFSLNYSNWLKFFRNLSPRGCRGRWQPAGRNLMDLFNHSGRDQSLKSVPLNRTP